jgi:hypothetical protein
MAGGVPLILLDTCGVFALHDSNCVLSCILLDDSGSHVLTSATSLAASALPLLHKAPFDRLFIASGRGQHLQILTSDLIIPACPSVITLW